MTMAAIGQKSLFRIATATGALLLVPLIAMQFTAEVNWTAFDFVFAGSLLFGTGLAYSFLAAKAGSIAYRAGAALAVVGALLLIWANLAVGIIGDENNPYNLMYAGVLAVGLVGVLVARFRPRGMAFAMVAMAVTQILIAMVAAIAGLGSTLAVTVFFVALWLSSARLFCSSERAD